MIIKSLEESILFTLSYFDVFELPLTFFEVWRYLFCFKAELHEIMETLDEMIRNGKIEMKNGFYFLPERSDLVLKRQEKYDISEKFWNKAIKAAKILSYLPFIKSIAVVNSLAFFNCDKKSDIDFLIITERNKIWTARALSSVLMHILGLRRYGKKVAKRICLSFYISEEKLDLSYIAKNNLGFFVAFWIAQSAPLINKGRAFNRFKDSNMWVSRYLPNTGHNITNYYIDFKYPVLSSFVSKTLEFLLRPHFVENMARAIQTKHIKRVQEKIGDPISVMFNDYILKFHPVDLRIEYKRELEKRLKKFFR